MRGITSFISQLSIPSPDSPASATTLSPPKARMQDSANDCSEYRDSRTTPGVTRPVSTAERAMERQGTPAPPSSIPDTYSQDYRNRRQAAPADRESRYKRQRDESRTKAYELGAFNSQLMRSLEAKSREMDELRKTLEKERRQYKYLEERYRDDLQAAKDDLLGVEQKYESTRRALKQQADELKGLRLFGSQEDDLSVADVINLLKSLNTDILQVAAFVADTLDFSSEPSEQVSSEDASKGAGIVARTIGREFAEALSASRKPKEEYDFDPTVVQYAFQVVMADYCSQAINDWVYNRDANLWIKGLYEGIRTSGKSLFDSNVYGTMDHLERTESQAVAGRWRAITARVQLEEGKDTDFIVKGLTRRLATILAVTGCSKSQAQVGNLRERFGSRLEGIANTIAQIRRAIAMGITSVDIQSYSCRSGIAFMAADMEDAYKEASSQYAGKRIAGTTEVGLLRREKSGPFTPLVKAKVLLVDVLRE